MTSRAHAAEPLADLRGIAFFGFPLHPPDKPGPEDGTDEVAADRRARAAATRAEHLARAGGPLLFLQGTRDDLADLSLLRPVVAGLGERARLHIVDGADHAFERTGRSRESVLGELAEVTGAWVTEVLTLEPPRR
jgi:hypothetical protein